MSSKPPADPSVNGEIPDNQSHFAQMSAAEYQRWYRAQNRERMKIYSRRQYLRKKLKNAAGALRGNELPPLPPREQRR